MSIKKGSFVLVQSLIDNFQWKILYQGNPQNKIKIPSLNRTGIELASGFVFKKIISGVLWSGHENKFLSLMKTNQDRINSMKHVLGMEPPVIILTKSFTYDELLVDLAKKLKTSTVILKSDKQSADLYMIVAAWINEQLAAYTTFHATLMNIYGVGVLIQGKSGVGKSEVALELVKDGHIFIADDAVDITNLGGKVYGKPTKIANDFIEVRGLGILNISRMYGVEKTSKNSEINVVIELVKKGDDDIHHEFERVGDKLRTTNILGIKVPYYKLPISMGRSTKDLIETSVIDYKLKMQGYNSAEEYMDNYLKVIK